jgi:hypothetical protein
MGALMITTIWRASAVAIALLWIAPGCQNTGKLSIRRTRDNQQLKDYRVRALTGLRDGEKLACELVVGDNQDTLTMQMRFQIGVPPRLETGTYVWQRKNAPQIQGNVKAEAVTFQGNQNGPPSLGGTFQLIAKDEELPLYEVKVPSTLMDAPGRPPASPK